MISDSNQRIAKNTIFLYVRTLFSMFVSLYTSRLILNILGVENFGIYNIVTSVVAMLFGMTTSLTASNQRFITFELGKEKNKNFKEVFSASINISILMILIVIFVLEVFGVWFLNHKLNIPAERMFVANLVFQCSIIITIIGVIKIPFMAVVIAHERMGALAYIGIIDVIIKLFCVVMLKYIQFDKLLLLALFTIFTSIVSCALNLFYCMKNFKECKYGVVKDKLLYKEMLAFSGWNFVGATSYALITQGMNILTNIFFGVVLNAARGITNQVNNTICQLVNNFMFALNPQITKCCAANKNSEMVILMQRGAKFSFILFFMFALPVMIETKMLLKLWLNIVPEYTVLFIRLSLVVTLVQTLSNTYFTGIMATGNIKKYQLLVGVIAFSIFLAVYGLLELGAPPSITYMSYIIIAFLVLILRLYIINKNIKGFNLYSYINDVIFRVAAVTVVSIVFPVIFHCIMPFSLLRLLIVSFSAVIMTMFSAFLIGVNKIEREKICILVISRIKQFKKN